MKFFVTGATGFLGGWLVKHLIEKGHDVSILARQKNLPPDLATLKLKTFKTDVLDFEGLKSALQNHNGVFHLAGYVGYKRSERKVMEEVNVQGTKNIVHACLANGVKRLLHVSTVNAIGATRDKTILNESSTYNLSKFNLGYSETKRAAEDFVRASCDRLDSVIVNPSTVYGPGDMKKGSRSVQVKVANGKFPFYTDGGVSVADVFEVVKAMLTAFEKGKTGDRYILGGENITIKEVFDLISREAGVKPPHVRLPKLVVSGLGHFGDLMESLGTKGPVNSESAILGQMYHWFDSSKAQRELNYKVVSAGTCIHNSIQWMKDNGWLKKDV